MLRPPDFRSLMYAAVTTLIMLWLAWWSATTIYSQPADWSIEDFDPELNCPTINEVIQQFGPRPLFGMTSVEHYFRGLCIPQEPIIRFSSQILGFEAVLPPITLNPGMYTAVLDTAADHIFFVDQFEEPEGCAYFGIFGFEPPTRFRIKERCTVFLTVSNNPKSLGHHWLLTFTKER